MTVNISLIVLAGALVACGVTLILERSLSRILIGFILLSNGINVLFLVAAGPAGRAPIVGSGDGAMSDPLPQAMVLTAIVISLGTTAFGLALAYRTWRLDGDDDVQDDLEDDLVYRRIELSESPMTDIDEAGEPDEEGADT